MPPSLNRLWDKNGYLKWNPGKLEAWTKKPAVPGGLILSYTHALLDNVGIRASAVLCK